MRTVSRASLAEEATPAGLVRMRLVATGLLVAMAAVFLVSRTQAGVHPGWGYVRAFAEAAMVAGMVPTALAVGGADSFRAPMSVTVMGGLIRSTVLTLLIVPSSFSLALGVEQTIGRKLGRRLLTYRPGDELGPVIDGHPAPTPIGHHRGPASLPAAE